jgi:elongation factor G
VHTSGADGGPPRKERVMKLLRVYAGSMTEVDEVAAGNIAAIVGLKATRTGDTLNGAAAAGVSLYDPTFSRTVWRPYGSSKGLVMWY